MTCSVMECLLSLIFITTIFVDYAASQGRIAGGFPMNITEVPYQVSVQYVYGAFRDHICGGAILTPDVAITAAHCTSSIETADMGIRVGSNVAYSGGQWRLVTKFQNHEEYNDFESGHDISLLFLESSLEFNDNVQPIVLNEQRVIQAGTLALVTGWGVMTYRGTRSDTLLGVELPIVEYDFCVVMLAKVGQIPEDVICAGFLEPGKDACQGDSGGPLVIDNKLVGLVSFGVECATTNYPGFYTNVASFVDWIKKYVEI